MVSRFAKKAKVDRGCVGERVEAPLRARLGVGRRRGRWRGVSSEVVGRFQGSPSLSNLAMGEVIGIVVKATFAGFAASEVGSAPLTNRADTAPRLEWWLGWRLRGGKGEKLCECIGASSSNTYSHHEVGRGCLVCRTGSAESGGVGTPAVDGTNRALEAPLREKGAIDGVISVKGVELKRSCRVDIRT